MKEHLTGYSLANDIRMTRSVFSGAFLIVEGSESDLKVYSNFVESTHCQIIPAHGKENALLAKQILEQNGFIGFLIVIDADFWRLQGISLNNDNLLVTDSHDLETMILASPALEKLLREHGSKQKLDNLQKQSGKDVRTNLLEWGREIGGLRFISIRESLRLSFEEMNFGRFITLETLLVNRSDLVKYILQRSRRYDLSEQEIIEKIDQVVNENHNLWDLCCGHDLVNVLSMGLRKLIGTNNAHDVKPEILEKDLRLAYEFFHFIETELYQSIMDWEERNKPFQILRKHMKLM